MNAVATSRAVAVALSLAALLIAGCARTDPTALLPATPAGYREIGDVGFWFVAPRQWRVLEEDRRQPRFAAEVVGPPRSGGVAPRAGLILDEHVRWEDLSALTAAFRAGAIRDAAATVVRQDRVDGMGMDALLVETSHRAPAGGTEVPVRQYDLLMVVDGVGVDLRVAAARVDFDEGQARTIVTSLRLPQTLAAAAHD
jgi:hypothetical protein